MFFFCLHQCHGCKWFAVFLPFSSSLGSNGLEDVQGDVKGQWYLWTHWFYYLCFWVAHWLEQFLPASCHNHFDSLKKWVSESKEHIIISHSTHMNNCNLLSGLCFTVAEPGFTSDSQSRCSYQSAPLGGSHWVFKHICRMVLLWEWHF